MAHVFNKPQLFKASKRRNPGFTIVELLIVIVVMGVLAAITIVAYNGIQNRANDTAVQNDLASIAKKIQLWNAEMGAYPSDWASASLSDPMYAVKVSKASYAIAPALTYNLFYCTMSPYTSFAFGATTKSGKRLFITSTSGVVEYIGAQTWSTSDISGMCNSILAGSVNSGPVGYTSAGPQWRTWTGN